MNTKQSLKQIIYKNKLSIQHNPYGITRLWPYSYINLFYSEFCNNLYQQNNSPNILEINQLNNLNLKIWEKFFHKPKVDNLTIKKIKNSKLLKYDMIIINGKDIFSYRTVIYKLISNLKPKGIIVIENIGSNSKGVIDIYIKFFKKLNLNIYDFRLNNFIRNNCILTITKRPKIIRVIDLAKSLYTFFIFISIEISIISFKFILKKFNNIKI